MPLIESRYRPPFPFRSGHVNTIVANLFRPVDHLPYRRVRRETPDGDFFDTDVLKPANFRGETAVLVHGLEASSQAPYIRSMAGKLVEKGFEVHAINLRSCSGEINRKRRFYSAGDGTDLAFLLKELSTGSSSIHLIGFSLGGNLVLHFAGSGKHPLPDSIRSVVALSAPVDLEEGIRVIESEWSRAIYRIRFTEQLRQKLREKILHNPDFYPADLPDSIRSIRDFDRLVTAPEFGFSDEWDYYRRSSALPVLSNIPVPVFLLNAEDDPVLSPSSFPRELAARHPRFHFEASRFGGHLGYLQNLSRGSDSYAELRTLEFLESIVSRNDSI